MRAAARPVRHPAGGQVAPSMLVAGRLGGTRTRSEPPPVGRAAPCQVPGRVTRSPDAARRTAPRPSDRPPIRS